MSHHLVPVQDGTVLTQARHFKAQDGYMGKSQSEDACQMGWHPWVAHEYQKLIVTICCDSFTTAFRGMSQVVLMHCKSSRLRINQYCTELNLAYRWLCVMLTYRTVSTSW